MNGSSLYKTETRGMDCTHRMAIILAAGRYGWDRKCLPCLAHRNIWCLQILRPFHLISYNHAEVVVGSDKETYTIHITPIHSHSIYCTWWMDPLNSTPPCSAGVRSMELGLLADACHLCSHLECWATPVHWWWCWPLCPTRGRLVVLSDCSSSHCCWPSHLDERRCEDMSNKYT